MKIVPWIKVLNESMMNPEHGNVFELYSLPLRNDNAFVFELCSGLRRCKFWFSYMD